MAEVYKSTHPDLGRDIAVKILHPFHTQIPGFIGRFRLEAQAAASLHHPNIVQVYDFAVTDDGLYYMVMQYINGLSLEEYLDLEKSPLTLSKAYWFFRQFANALQFAHQRGTIHRDVKPANIMLDTRENAYLSDFGLAKIVGVERQTLSGMSPGTPSYMAPEHIGGKKITAAVDIYAMGVILYRMLTTQLPFDGDNLMTIITRTLTETPVSPREHNPDIPQAVEDIILKAMSRDPKARFVDAATMNRALADALAEAGETLPVKNTSTPMGVIPLPGVQLDNYKVKREFVRDSVSVSRRYFQRYLAHNIALDTMAVLTVLKTSADDDSSFSNRFQQRMDVLTLLDHPGLAAITRVDKTPNNQPYVAYEHIPGQSLETQLAESGANGANPGAIEALQCIRQIAAVLAVVHEADILHNDLRPENIVIRDDGTPVLVGLEIPIAPDSSARGDAAKVLDYASPEQLEGKPIGEHSNIYSLGVMLYEFLAGHRPILNWDDLDDAHMPMEVPLETARPGLTAETYRLVQDCLQRPEEARLARVDAFMQRVDEALAAESALQARTEQSIGRRRQLYTAVPIAALVILMLGLGFLRGRANSLEDGATPTIPPTAMVTVVPAQVVVPTQTAAPSAMATTILPVAAPTDEASPTPTNSPTATSSPSTTPTPTSTPTITPTPECVQPEGWVEYVVKEGEALFNLALNAGATVEEIMQANCLTSNVLSIGQRVWFPISPVTMTPTPSRTPTGTPLPPATRRSTRPTPTSLAPTKTPQPLDTPTPPSNG